MLENTTFWLEKSAVCGQGDDARACVRRAVLERGWNCSP
jgi:hypothetical protein